MDAWNYILGYRNTLKSVFETWVVHIPFKGGLYSFVAHICHHVALQFLY